MKKLITVVALVAALSLSLVSMAFAASGGLKLHPSGFGPKSQATWKGGQGLPDSSGNGKQALYFQKMTTTATVAAGVAMINGVEGIEASELTGLEWQHRNDGHCGAGAPRWNIGLTDSNGQDYNVFLGCAAAAHSPGSGAGWTRDTYSAAAIGAAVADPGDTVRYLAIIFDEGTDNGPGFVYLDNIKVNDQVWTSATDNGN